MTDEEILLNSPLWKAILSDKEIRYSDFIGLFMERFNENLFNEISFKDPVYRISREKQSTDLWIDRVINEKIPYRNGQEKNHDDDNESEIEEPIFLVENKLKSLPFQDQLRSYTEKFVNEYISALKKEYKARNPSGRINNWRKEFSKDEHLNSKLQKVKELEFYLLTPFKHLDIEVKVTETDILKEELKFNWKNISYSCLGTKIKGRLATIKKKKKEYGYLIPLFKDFGNILQSMEIFSEVKNFDEGEPILDIFKPRGIFKREEFQNMKDFYQKYRASQCADYLRNILSKDSIVEKWTVNKMKELEVGKKVVNYSFSNRSGLFEVATRVNEDLIFVIQYQGGALKKALVLKSNTEKEYKEWLSRPWGQKTFHLKQIKDSKIKECYRYGMSGEYTFYYSMYDVSQNDTVEKICKLMKKKISEGISSLKVIKVTS